MTKTEAKDFVLSDQFIQDWQRFAPLLSNSHKRELKTKEESAYKDFSKELEDLGHSLLNTVFDDVFQESLNNAITNLADDEQLLIRLNIKDPDLARLPWELLYTDKFLVTQPKITFVRNVEKANADFPKEIEVRGPLRILLVGSQAIDLDIDGEFKGIQDALLDLELKSAIEIDILPNASFADLSSQLRTAEPYHVIHFASHASKEQGGQILLGDKVQTIDAQTLAENINFRGGNELKLVILNACESGATDESSQQPFSSLAQSLIDMDIPAVIAMQLAIADSSAINFSKGFYDYLSQTGDIALALNSGRINIKSINHDWITPILYSRADNLQLFKD